MPSLKRPTSTLAQMALSSNEYVLKMQRLEKILTQKGASNSARMADVAKIAITWPFENFWSRLLRQNLFYSLHYKCILIRG